MARLMMRIEQAEAALARIVEVNERLLVVALAARADADTAATALDEARSAATVDALTGLLLRSTMAMHVVQAIAQARRRGGHLALLFVDLDGFKALNDSWGHGFGDNLLRIAAARLRAAVREEDAVGRHGGDEFVVLLADLASRDDAGAVAHKLAAAIAEPIPIGAQVARVTASIGVAIYPDDGEDMAALLEHADAAMYAAKRRAGTGPAA